MSSSCFRSVKFPLDASFRENFMSRINSILAWSTLWMKNKKIFNCSLPKSLSSLLIPESTVLLESKSSSEAVRLDLISVALSLPWFVYASWKYHRLGGLLTMKMYFSQFLRLWGPGSRHWFIDWRLFAVSTQGARNKRACWASFREHWAHPWRLPLSAPSQTLPPTALGIRM